MTKTKAKTKGYTAADMREVSERHEWTKEDFRRARKFSDVFPELAEKIRRARGAQKAPTKKQVSIRLDQDVLDRFKKDGAGWQSRVNEALRKSVGLK